jgi:hypothetical protein
MYILFWQKSFKGLELSILSFQHSRLTHEPLHSNQTTAWEESGITVGQTVPQEQG